MKVGDVVCIRWLDSGLRASAMALEEALTEELHVVTAYGQVVFLDEDRVVVAHDLGPEGHGDFGVIWVPCIQSAVVLREDVVDSIIEEVDYELKDPWVEADRKSRSSTRKTARLPPTLT